jgi:hypothetical protein
MSFKLAVNVTLFQGRVVPCCRLSVVGGCGIWVVGVNTAFLNVSGWKPYHIP